MNELKLASAALETTPLRRWPKRFQFAGGFFSIEVMIGRVQYEAASGYADICSDSIGEFFRSCVEDERNCKNLPPLTRSLDNAIGAVCVTSALFLLSGVQDRQIYRKALGDHESDDSRYIAPQALLDAKNFTYVHSSRFFQFLEACQLSLSSAERAFWAFSRGGVIYNNFKVFDRFYVLLHCALAAVMKAEAVIAELQCAAPGVAFEDIQRLIARYGRS